MSKYGDRVVTFGDGGYLAGVLTTPVEARAGAPVVLLLNPGILHHVGANRMHVLLSRSLAELGFTTLRFDLSGIGDSERHTLVTALPESVARDVAAAMSFLTAKHGATQFVLGGLCSGAYDAFHAALRDPRIVGVIAVDIPGPFRSLHHWLYEATARMRRRPRPIHGMRRLLQVAKALTTIPRRQRPVGIFAQGVRPRSTREAMSGDLDTLLQRSVQLLFVFTAGVPENYRHKDQFRRAFRKAAKHPNVSVTYFPDADHTFSVERSRQALISVVRDWIAPIGNAAAQRVRTR